MGRSGRAAADLCASENLWLHIDACYGGAIALLPEWREVIANVGRAQSIAVDPHKWFFIPVTAALLLVREAGLAARVFDTAQGTYIPGDGAIDAWRRGIPTTRRSSGLAVWMALRAHGWAIIRQAVQSNIALMRLLEQLLLERGFDVRPAVSYRLPARDGSRRTWRGRRAIRFRKSWRGAWWQPARHGSRRCGMAGVCGCGSTW